MTGRPIVLCAGTAAAALFLAAQLGIPLDARILGLLLGLGVLALAFALTKPRLRAALIAVCAACTSLLFLCAYTSWVVAPVRSCNGRVLEITATLRSDPVIYEDNQRARLRVDPVGKAERPFQVYCYLPLTEEPLLAGDTVRLKARFYLASDSEGFDRAAYQAANGCFIATTCAKDADGKVLSFSWEVGDRDGLQNLPARIARACKARIDALYPGTTGALMRALLLGDRTALDHMDYAALRKAGLSHLVAVSGLHVGFLVSFCCLLFGRRWGSLFSILAIACFMPVAGLTPSVVRAGIMYLITVGGFFLKREADSLNSLFIALLILLAGNPYAILSLGLQLSFSATLGLILFAGPLQKQILQPLPKTAPSPVKSFCTVIAGTISCSICSLLFTTPFLLSSFGYVSVLSVLSNLVVSGVTAVCFVSGLLSCALYGFALPAARLMAGIATPLLRYIQYVANGVSRVPFGLLYCGDAFGLASLALFFAAVFTWLVRTKLRRAYTILTVCCAAMLISAAVGLYREHTRYSMTVLSCGDGEALIVSETGGEMVLVDCGSSAYQTAADQVEEWMLWHGFDRIDTLVLTAVDLTHARDLPALMDIAKPASIAIPHGCKETKYNAELLLLLRNTDVPVREVSAESVCAEELPVQAFPVTDGKLGVAIGEEVKVLHSPTQKQLAAYLQENDCAAPTAILSGRQVEDGELLRDALARLGTTHIILQSGWNGLSGLDGITVSSTRDTGEQVYHYPKEAA